MSAMSALVPASVPAPKKSKSELAMYVLKSRRSDMRTSSLFAPIVTLTGHEGEIFSGKFSPDGSILATAGFDRRIFLWNVYGECENSVCLAGHASAITDLRFNHDGRYVSYKLFIYREHILMTIV
jgi:Prp8 binding protein